MSRRTLDRASPAESATLVAIAKNEGRYILEWVAYHLAVGFTAIVVYDDGSTDDMPDILARIARACPEVTVRSSGPVGFHDSPQTTAYNAAVKDIHTKWTMFLDIDEFLVPFRDYTVDAFLARVPRDVGSVHVNWRGFGSGGRSDPAYGLVTETFTRCSPSLWGNNHHFKSIARTILIDKVYIHNIITTSGRRVLSDFEGFETVSNGMASRIVHSGIQINHYQSKTFEEFRARMERGDANYHADHWNRGRNASHARFIELDINEIEDTTILAFKARFDRVYQEIRDAM